MLLDEENVYRLNTYIDIIKIRNYVKEKIIFNFQMWFCYAAII